MALTGLQIRNLRCLCEVDWSPGAGVNVVFGANGAGKTTLLEAVLLAARGKSWRPGGVRAAIRNGAESVAVRAAFGEGLEAGWLAYERSARERRWVQNGEPVRSPLSAYQALPVLILSPESHYETLQDPQVRRTAMQWAMFHVEPLFLETWRRYQRVLRQRNSALRNGDRHYRMFDPGLAQAGEALAGFWEGLGREVEPLLQDGVTRLHLGRTVGAAVRRGWTGESLLAALAATQEADERLGYTQAGPHRADVQFTMEGRPLAQIASHGQQKIVASAWRLALAARVHAAGAEPLLLIDDLGAELDGERRQAFYETLGSARLQAVVTAIESDPSMPTGFSMFHVEHGGLSAP